MEYLDFLILGVGCIIFFEGARRLDLIALANKLRKNISNTSEEGIQDNCLSFKILWSPSQGAKWSPGVGAAINNRPFVIFLLVILTLTGLGAILSVVSRSIKISLLIVAIVFSLALHSGPDNISTKERYLQVIAVQDPDELNGHDLRILTKNIKEYRSWPWFQLVFGIVFATSVFWPDWFFLVGFAVILIAGFCFLGSKYSIHRGVFGSEPGT